MADTGAAPKRRASWGRRLGAALLGVAVGLALTEVAFAARDDGAFPHLNVFEPDEELGVRLAPSRSQRVRFANNPATDVTIGPHGFRGAAPQAEGAILVVGDSQVFGLGVNDDETFAHRLGELTERETINGGVPTYGPLEYTAVVRRVLRDHRPSTIVYVLNMSNDWFEHSRSNRERHAVWDGWAVRTETAPRDVTEFPGRALLYRDSHAFYALRRWLHETDDTIEATRVLGFASEGTLSDLVRGGDEASAAHAEADRLHREQLAARHAQIVRLNEQLGGAEAALEERLVLQEGHDYEGTRDLELRAADDGHPGDIVSEDFGEESRSIVVTAALLSQAVRLRNRVEEEAVERDPEAAALVATRQRLRAERERARARGVAEGFVPSVLAPRIEEVHALAEEHGAELVVVALPLDVLVSDAEFAKYGAEPVDVSASRVLLEDLVETAHRLGVRAVDTTDALRAAEPGAFLDGDLHLSPSGHRAVAEAIAATLAAPAPLPHPAPGLPEGRTAVPDPDAWLHTEEATVRGSTAARCVTHLVNEWLRVSCRAHRASQPTGAAIVEGGRGEAMTIVTDEAATLVAPVFAGEALLVDFHWTDRTQRLEVRWPEGAGAPTMAFVDPIAPARPEAAIGADAERACACHREVLAMAHCDPPREEYAEPECRPSCEELYGDASPACFTAYRDDCASLLRCLRGDPELPPPCEEEGHVNALGTFRCVALCRPDGSPACAEGTRCVPWAGTHVCASTP